MRDIKELIDLELLLFDNNTYYANIDLLKKIFHTEKEEVIFVYILHCLYKK